MAEERRIVSLLPSATEIVCGLGLKHELVGRSHECDFPAGVEALPICTEPKLDPSGNSGAIHAEVEEILRSALGVYNVFSDLLRDLRPTHIVTQVQCDVCAVSLEDVERAIADWSGQVEAPVLVPLNPSTLDDVFADIQRVADALGLADRGQWVVASLSDRMNAIASQAETFAAKPRVASIEWQEPLMSGGNWMPELVEMGGGENLFGERGVHSPWIQWEAIVEADPDVLVVFPCGFSLAHVRRDMHYLTERAEWGSLAAVRNDQVYLCDGNHYFNRPGPRLVESLEIMAEILHPSAFRFGHEGAGWERFSAAN